MSLKKKKAYTVAVVGATGAVGTEMLKTLEQRDFPVGELRAARLGPLRRAARSRSGEPVKVEELTEGSFAASTSRCSAPGGSVSKKFAPRGRQGRRRRHRQHQRLPHGRRRAAGRARGQPGATSRSTTGIIANPNCSTIQMVVALKPLHDAARIKRIVVSTYQARRGAGSAAMDELREQTRERARRSEARAPKIFPHQIAFNCIPQIPQSTPSSRTATPTEEMKMVNETRKIMGDQTIRVSATTRARAGLHRPQRVGQRRDRAEAHRRPRRASCCARPPASSSSTTRPRSSTRWPSTPAGKDAVFVGRIREDISHRERPQPVGRQRQPAQGRRAQRRPDRRAARRPRPAALHGRVRSHRGRREQCPMPSPDIRH